MPSLLEHLQALFAEGSSVFDKIDYMLHLKEDLEAIEPHDLVRPCVRRDDVGPFSTNDVQQVLEVRLVSFLILDLNWFLALRVFEVA